MTTNVIETQWNPVNLAESVGGSKKGYTINNYSVSSGWYNKEIRNDGARLARLKRLHEADQSSIEIDKALDTITEDITAINADDEDDVFYFDYPDDSKTKKTAIKITNEMLKMWVNRTGFDESLFERVRYVLKFGAKFFKKNRDGSLKHLPNERFVGYVLSDTDEDRVTHYIYDPDAPRIEYHDEKAKAAYNLGKSTNKNYEFISVDDLFIMKVGEGPFGKSIIDRVYRVWRQMALIEDAIIIYRVVRAPERRIYYIDVGNLQGPKREAAIERQRLRLMQKQINRKGQVETEYDPHSTGEDIFIPTNSSGKGSRIETLPAGQNLGELDDLKWFANKMAAGLRVPKSMTDIQSEDERDQYSDMRVGALYQSELRYLGMVNRYKKALLVAFFDNFKEFCKERDFIIPDDAVMKITEAHSFALYKEMELNQTALNIFNSTLQIESLSKRYALQKYLNFEQEEIILNEDSKLLEMGITEDKIKDMPMEHRMNLCYGDKHVANEYGIEAEEGGVGGRRW